MKDTSILGAPRQDWSGKIAGPFDASSFSGSIPSSLAGTSQVEGGRVSTRDQLTWLLTCVDPARLLLA